MKPWLKGGLIGIGIVILLVATFSICLYGMRGQGEGGLICLLPAMPLIYISTFTGMDSFVAGDITSSINETFKFFFPIILGGLIFIIICSFIGFLFEKEISWKKKLIIFLILVLVFSPLSIYTHYLKYNDNKIMLANKINGAGEDYPKSGIWNVTDYRICDKISKFNNYEKEECYESALENTGDLSICDKLTFKWAGKGC